MIKCNGRNHNQTNPYPSYTRNWIQCPELSVFHSRWSQGFFQANFVSMAESSWTGLWERCGWLANGRRLFPSTMYFYMVSNQLIILCTRMTSIQKFLSLWNGQNFYKNITVCNKVIFNYKLKSFYLIDQVWKMMPMSNYYLFCVWSLLAILSGSEAIALTMLSDVCCSILGISTPVLPPIGSWHISHNMSPILCCLKNSSRRETVLLNPIPGLQKKSDKCFCRFVEFFCKRKLNVRISININSKYSGFLLIA